MEEIGRRAECWCGRRARGDVKAEAGVLGHRCGQCGPEHCQHAEWARRCEFRICPREAELELVLSDTVEPVRVCGLHVSAVLGWGVPEPTEPRVRYLASQQPGAAA